MLLATEIYNVLSNTSVSNISETISRYTYIKSGLLELCIIYDNEISYILCISNKVASAWIIFEDEQTQRQTDTHTHAHTHVRAHPLPRGYPWTKMMWGKKSKNRNVT